jgi:acyl-coenzyme A synthetase/AMP-(fatty) acid ligase
MAVAVPGEGSDEPALARALFEHAATRLAYFKVPAVILFRDALPVTSTQKLRRLTATSFSEDPAKDVRGYDFRNEKQVLRRSVRIRETH